MRFVAGNAQNIGARPQQQDAFGFSDPGDPKFVSHAGFLGVVADGMGGLTHGSEASRSAVHAFLAAYKRKSAGESIPKALTRCLGEANLGVHRIAKTVPAAEEVGTTLVAAVLHDHTLYWISVGDSRVYLLRGNTVTQLTADHVYARELNRQAAEGKISLREALNHPERSSLTSYLGQTELVHVDKNVRPLEVKSDDCVMLCTDGFYRALTEEELVAGFRKVPQMACDTLLGQALAKNRKQQDNLTVIALKRLTRSRFPRRLKLGLTAVAMLLIIVGGGAGYLIGRHFAPTSAGKPSPGKPDQTASPTPPQQPTPGPQPSQQNASQPENPSAAIKSSQNSTKTDRKKNDHATAGGSTKEPAQTQHAPKQHTTHAGQQQSTQQAPPTTPDAGEPEDKTIIFSQPKQKSDQQNSDQQGKPSSGQPAATPPAKPTTPAAPSQPNTQDKKDTPTPPGNDDQTGPPPAPPKDNPPLSHPNTALLISNTYIQGARTCHL